MSKILGPILIFLLTLLCLFIQPELRDARIVPIVLIAVLLSPMLVEWIVGARDLLNPSGLIAVLLFQFMVVSPTLAFVYDNYDLSMNDTRSLLSRTLWMCLPGVLAFFVGHWIPIGKRFGWKVSLSPRCLNIPRARMASVFLIVAGILASAAFLAIAIGRGGTWETRFSATMGLGYMMAIGEFLKIGLLLLVSISIQKYLDRTASGEETGKHLPVLTAYVVMFMIVFLLVFRGSRGSIILYLFWIIGMIHLTVKRYRRIYLVVLLFLGLPALHMYGLYKAFGLRAFGDYWNPSLRAGMEEASNQSILGVLIGDLGRINVWMYAHQEITEGRFPHAYGTTYAGGSVAFIPLALWPNRPSGMPETITDMVRGKGAYRATQEKTSRVAGLIGEAYINFGWPCVMVVMFLYGVLVRSVSVWVENAPLTAAKAFLAPLLILLLMYLFIWDWVWIVFKLFSQIIPVYIIYRFVFPKAVSDGQEEVLDPLVE
jgi:hypothetical protein